MAFKVEQIYTDNPYTDIVVYNTKVLGINTVLKMKDVADANETEESLKNADIYIASVENTAIWEIYDSFPEEVLRGAGLSGVVLAAALLDKEAVPDELRPEVVRIMKLYVQENYEELNNYYRMLTGLPPVEYLENVVSGVWDLPYNMPENPEVGMYCYANVYDEEGELEETNWYRFGEDHIWTITTEGPKTCVRDWDPNGMRIDLTVPIHLMNEEAILILENNGVLDEMYKEDPNNRGYLRYLDRKISPYAARKAAAFYPLYIPTIDSTELLNEYKDRLEINRRYALSTVYSQAYKYESDYYDNFVAVFIILNTITDIISRVQEFIARKEIFDLRSCRYIFESYGVPFYAEIPLKYQIRMVKNLHTLLKYKSTAKCMVDICSLFGFDNIQIFKYYLLRERVKGGDGKYSFEMKEDGTEDYDANFDLKFVKIPIDKEMDEYIRDPTYQVGYDELTAGDPTWDGGLNHDDVKTIHKSLNYNYTRTKYFSVDAIYDLAKIAIQQAYFFNMLYDDNEIENQITVTVPMISEEQIEISQLFTFLSTLTFRYYGIKDMIIDTASKVLTVNGFNFKADLAELQNLFEYFNLLKLQEITDPKYLISEINRAYDSLKNIKLPVDTQIPTFNQLMSIFKNNLDIRQILVLGMKNASDNRTYTIYKKLYDSLMTMELTTTHFADPETGELWRDEQGDATYTEWLRHVNPTLYYKLIEIDNIEDPDNKSQMIATLLDNVIFILEEYIDTDEFSGIFHGLPAVTSDAVKEYIRMVIDFYKSYKVHFLGVNTLYTFDDDLEGWIKIIDEGILNLKFWKNDIIPVVDSVAAQLSAFTKHDAVRIKEKIYLDIRTWIMMNITEHVNIRELMSKFAIMRKNDKVDIRDEKIFNFFLHPDDILPIIDTASKTTVIMTLSDYIGITDSWMEGEYTDVFNHTLYGIDRFTQMTGPNEIEFDDRYSEVDNHTLDI